MNHKSKINIIFFGSSKYSIPILDSLLNTKNFTISAVITKPDQPFDRKKIITPNPLAKFAQSKNLNIIKTDTFDSKFTSQFKALNPDLGLVVAYGPPFFTTKLINIPKYKIINIHPSPLPKYRGATPAPWQIINNEKTSAVTFFKIDNLPDHGPIVCQIPFKISTKENSDSFYQKAFNLATKNLEKTIKNYIKNFSPPLEKPNTLTPQNHSQATYFPKLTKLKAQINWSWPNPKINRFIRAMQPWPTAWAFIENRQSGKILKMKIYSSIVKKKLLIPQSVQIENKKTTNWSQISPYYTIVKN
ncbi:methionyl-tRNA formyltransferase [Patescibacteria group bacterium]|nr:methionyl-tRNA formyltransferase [Patescibacteria group bacterium]MCG2701891.1 methionyl-tRNA formyltransferase [Candidatus Parcubacteria bacterium]MBU4264901.1 methionyl-tRNA formyltransferase [Patescibacteria group bacterium]MBU4389927.1 methionyl-tRNA formyltransferase [Patescibacteria group bacterium]MBU4396806.1 methionyl-tRNA formyltransferase [Patescibacteria group bacterium]